MTRVSPVFASKRQLTDALNKARLTSGNDAAARWINALIQRFCVSDDAEGRVSRSTNHYKKWVLVGRPSLPGED